MRQRGIVVEKRGNFYPSLTFRVGMATNAQLQKGVSEGFWEELSEREIAIPHGRLGLGFQRQVRTGVSESG